MTQSNQHACYKKSELYIGLGHTKIWVVYRAVEHSPWNRGPTGMFVEVKRFPTEEEAKRFASGIVEPIFQG